MSPPLREKASSIQISTMLLTERRCRRASLLSFFKVCSRRLIDVLRFAITALYHYLPNDTESVNKKVKDFAIFYFLTVSVNMVESR